MQKEKRIEIGQPAWVLYLLLIIAVLFADFADLVCYLLKWEQATFLSRCFVFAALAGVVFLFKGKVRLSVIGKSRITWFVAAFFLIWGFLKGVMPDSCFDTYNYHLIGQDAGFIDAFGYHLAPGNFQFFGFQLPDRLFYPFRLLFGYRMGTLLNAFVAILVYVQTRDLLVLVAGEKFKEIQENGLSFLPVKLKKVIFSEAFAAIFIVIVHDLSTEFGSYLIDLLSVPVGLEMLRVLVSKQEVNRLTNLYYAFLAGLLFCFKMTNVVYVLPLLILYLVKNRKSISFPLFIGCFVLALLPVSIYLLYNYAETGNPIFPYFNTLFQSEHFPTSDFKDVRWGPSNIKEFLLWFFYMIFFPNYRQSEIPNPWAIGGIGMFVAALWYLFTVIRKKGKPSNPASPVYITFIGSYLLWAYTTGYLRYFLFGYILGGILFTEFCLRVFLRYRHFFPRVLVSALACVFVISPFVFVHSSFNGYETNFNAFNSYDFVNNVKYVFRDRVPFDREQCDRVDAFVVNTQATGGLAYLINENVPILSQEYVNQCQGEKEKKEILQRIHGLIEEDKNVCGVYYPPNCSIDEYITRLTDSGLKLVSCEWLEGKMVNLDRVVITSLGQLAEGETNRFYFANSEENNVMQLLRSSDGVSLAFNAGYSVHFGWYPQDGIFLQVTVSDEQGNVVYDRIPIKEGEFYKYSHDFDLAGFASEITVTYDLVYGNGERFDVNGPNRFVVWNPEVNNANIK